MTTSCSITPPPFPAEQAWGFVDEIRRPAGEIFALDLNHTPATDQLDPRSGFTIVNCFPDPEHLLETAIKDLEVLLTPCGLLCKTGVPIQLARDTTLKPEAYRLEVQSSQITIAASDTEGIRHGIYALRERMLGADGPVLRVGCTEYEPVIANRISRCFFGPIRRPPANRDELLDDVDYYPDAYLSRLASQGVNGLWLTIAFRDLCTTSLAKPCEDAPQRLAKLRETVAKCRPYGIKIWAFCIEPAGFALDDPMLERYPELAGPLSGNKRCFCPSSDVAQQYLYEATRSVFSAVPHLGGLLNITHGERATTCLSSVSATVDRPVMCPRCGTLPKWKILHQSLSAMRAGMDEAAPGSQLISWFYMPQARKRPKWVFDCAANTPNGVIFQYNFESNATQFQLGRPHVGGDYWLSFVGPSSDYARLSSEARNAGVETSAKIQVGCSHELATVPYVPVPSLLYRKYQAIRDHGARHVMQGWYFGHYPGLMNHVAGRASFIESGATEESEQVFLLRQARRDWHEHASVVVRAWEQFARAYKHYPFSNHFQYYGPVHDGVVWPLHLYPALQPLSPTWRIDYPASGDVIGECAHGFSLPELIELCERMADEWQKGVDILDPLRAIYAKHAACCSEIGLAEAIGIQFDSARNILRFYWLRQRMLTNAASAPNDLSDQMRELVQTEIQNSRRLIGLCVNDPTLGFHAEAEAYKYCPDRLRWRIEHLEHLLAYDFPAVDRTLAGGGRIPGHVQGQPEYRSGQGWIDGERLRWRLDQDDKELRIQFECRIANLQSSVLWAYLLDEYGVHHPWMIPCDPEHPVLDDEWTQIEIYEQTDDLLTGVMRLSSLAWDNDPLAQPRHVGVQFYGRPVDGTEMMIESWPAVAQPVKPRTGFRSFHPGNLAYLVDSAKPKFRR